MKKSAIQWVAVALLAFAAPALATVHVTVDPGHAWLGYMNVSNLPAPQGDGAYQFGSAWGTADLSAVFTGPVLKLTPNSIGDPNEYWYIGGGGPGAPGNKIMEANMYVENSDTLVGETIIFKGVVKANTLTSAHTAIAFIKDFAPDYSSFVQTTVPLTPGQFSISLATDPTPGRHVQFGFQMTGVNVWVTDLAPFGYVDIVPEPTTLALGLALTGAFVIRRRR